MNAREERERIRLPPPPPWESNARLLSQQPYKPATTTGEQSGANRTPLSQGLGIYCLLAFDVSGLSPRQPGRLRIVRRAEEMEKRGKAIFRRKSTRRGPIFIENLGPSGPVILPQLLGSREQGTVPLRLVTSRAQPPAAVAASKSWTYVAPRALFPLLNLSGGNLWSRPSSQTFG